MNHNLNTLVIFGLLNISLLLQAFNMPITSCFFLGAGLGLVIYGTVKLCNDMRKRKTTTVEPLDYTHYGN